MKLVKRQARWLFAVVVVLAAACAAPSRTGSPGPGSTGPWSGRLAVQVEDPQAQSFSAGFELKGSARSGELVLRTPLGSTLAVLDWAPGIASLRGNGPARQFESVDALVMHATGAAIPVAALFDWLAGIGTPVAGWRADLSQLSQGRLHATRVEPPPQTDLRVVLDR